MFQPGANLYTQGFGSRAESVEVPHIERRNPSATDINFPIGKRWLNVVSEQESILYSFSVVNGVTVAVWSSPLGPSGALDTLSDGTTKVSPDGTGNIAIVGTSNQISVTSNAGSHQLQTSLPNVVVAPGSLSVTNGFSVLDGSVDIQTGTNALNIDTSSTGDISIGQATGSQTVTILAGAGGINIDSDSGSNINIGNVLDTNNSIGIGNSNTPVINMGAQTTNIYTYDIPGINVNALIDGTLSLNTSAGTGNTIIGNSSNTLTVNSNSTFLAGGLSVNNTFVNPGSYDALMSDCFLNCNTAGPITINLPTILGYGNVFIIVDTAGVANANNITINAPPGGNICVKSAMVAASYTISENFGSVILIGTPGNYYVISQGG